MKKQLIKVMESMKKLLDKDYTVMIFDYVPKAKYTFLFRKKEDNKKMKHKTFDILYDDIGNFLIALSPDGKKMQDIWNEYWNQKCEIGRKMTHILHAGFEALKNKK